MRTMNKLCLVLATLALSACSFSSSNTIINPIAEYEAMTPFQFSDTRVKHVGLISDMDLRIQMEQGLMDLSKEYFAPSEVGFRTHVFLDFDTLDATDGSRGLLGTNRDNNPNGLNPAREEAFDTGNGTVTGATILLDIYELDFYKNDHLKGISLAMVVNDCLDKDGQDVMIQEKVIQNYIEVTSNKLVSYMRERYNEISKNIPIYIAAYQLNTQDDTSKGHFIYEGLFEDNNSKFSTIDEQWVNIPSNKFTSMDAKTADEFNTFKEDIATVLPDQTYVVGKARYEKNDLKKMDLVITAHGKTASEILAVCQTIQESMDTFKDTDCTYLITVYNDEEVYAMIQRLKNSKEATIVSKL